MVYANPDKQVDRAYGTWLRAPSRNAQNQNVGSRWLRNGVDVVHSWSSKAGETSSTTVQGDQQNAAKFMEIDGRVSKILGNDGIVCYNQRHQRDRLQAEMAENKGKDLMGGKQFEILSVVTDTKRKRLNEEINMERGNKDMENHGLEDETESSNNVGPKNLIEAGPVLQARLTQ